MAESSSDNPKAEQLPHLAPAALESLLTRLVEAAVQFDPHHRIVWLNAAAASLFGIPDDRAVGRRLADLAPGDLAAQCEAELARVLESDSPRIGTHPDSRSEPPRHLEAHYTPFEDPGDGTRYVLMVCHDISARVARSEHEMRELREQAAVFRSIFENAAAGIVELDPDGVIRRINPAFETMLGYPGPQLAGRPFAALSAGPTPDFSRLFAGLAEGGPPPHPFEHECVRADGIRHWVQLSLTAGAPARDGTPASLLVVAVDIQSRKGYEQQLAAEHRRLGAILDSTTEGVLEVRADAVVDFANEAAAQVLGRARHELIGEDVYTLLYGDAANAQRGIIALALDRGVTRRDREDVFRRGDGIDAEVAVSTVLLDGAGGEGAVLVVFHDLGERRRAEAALREKEQLYRQMFQNNRAIKLLIDPASGAIVDANPAAASFYGYTVDQLKRKYIADINTLSPQQVKAEMARAKAEQRLYFRFRHRLASGEVRDVEVYSGPVYVGDKELLHSLVHDVTAQHRAHERLKVYRDLFQTLPVGIYRSTPGPEGRFLEANPAMVAMFEAESEQALLECRVSDVYQDPKERAAFSQALMHGKGAVRREVQLRSLQGRPIWAAITARRAVDDEGQVCFDGIIENITGRKEAELARDRLIGVLEATPDFVSIADLDGRVEYINAGGRRMAGLADPPTGKTVPADFEQAGIALHPPWASQLIEEVGIPTALREGVWEGETALLDAEGEEVAVSQIIIAQRNSTGEVDRIATIMRDISHLKAYENQLADQLQFQRTLLQAVPLPVFVKDREGRYTECNEQFSRMLGMPVAAILGKSARDIAPRELAEQYEQADRALFQRQGNQRYEAKVRFADGRYHHVIFNKSTFNDVHGAVGGIIGAITDISERRRLEKELEHRATHDPLTGAYNRLKFETLLEQQVAETVRYDQPLSLVMLDIDHFKRVNDSHGHDVGDRVLQEMVNTLGAQLRRADMLARWGGEEFMVLAPQTDLEGAVQLAEKARRAIEAREFDTAGHVTASFGVAEFRDGEPLKQWLKRVDDALYTAKQQGRNRVVAAERPGPNRNDAE